MTWNNDQQQIVYLPIFEGDGVVRVVSLFADIVSFVSIVMIETNVSTTTRIEKAAAPLNAMPIFFSLAP